MRPFRTVIIGGGLAGMAAAETLSRLEPSMEITLLESNRRLGGRVGSYVDPTTGDEIDYCQHAAMGCCTNLIDLIGQCGLETHLRRYQELTFLHPDHPPSRFSPSRLLPPPLHLLGAIAAQRYLSRKQQGEIKRGLWKLMRSRSASLADVRARRWLIDAGQQPETIRIFWDVILVSALGEQTEHVSMAAARQVLIDGFAQARGASDVLVPTLPLVELFGRMLADALVKRGVDVRTGHRVQQINPDATVTMASGRSDTLISADAVICAVPWYRIARLFDRWPDEARSRLPNLDAFSNIPSSPITGLHLWFDRPITELDHAVMVGTLSQWLFRDPHRRPIEKGDQGSPKQSYYQVVISASIAPASFDGRQLVDAVLGELRHAFPGAHRARLLRHRVVTDPKSVFSIRPEVDAIRPAALTDLPWLLLAGDWTQTGWPATMEGAVISGRIAADAALKRFGLPGSESAPANGLLATLPPSFLARWVIRQD